MMMAGTAQGQINRLGSWEIHDENRPAPPVVAAGTASTQEEAGRPPADAVVLFGGKNLDAWQTPEGSAAPWIVREGYFEVLPGSGGIRTREAFGDVQLHVEWQSPNPARGSGQDRGNSGVFLMDQYEVQVLDSYGSATYPDGQAGALYGQYPPLVNAVNPPGVWNTYDIIFHRPRFGEDGSVQSPAKVTVLLNGLLVQDGVELTGPTAHHARPPYSAHADALPISLQDHNHPVRYRNMWVRRLSE